ncbi:MAG: hypothetical protein ACE5GG_01875, partial [Candidatus Omnitrophota bacterium]
MADTASPYIADNIRKININQQNRIFPPQSIAEKTVYGTPSVPDKSALLNFAFVIEMTSALYPTTLEQEIFPLLTLGGAGNGLRAVVPFLKPRARIFRVIGF